MALVEGNRALTFLAESYSGHPSTKRLIDVLPVLADALYTKATATAAVLSQGTDQPLSTGSRELLATCILELELVCAFQAVLDHTRDSALSSCYVDAVFFQAIGQEAGRDPTEIQYLAEGTQKCRGIAKYQQAKKYLHVGDPDAWLFGKEYSAIITGNALNFACISAVQPLTLLIRIRDGKWLTRYLLTGQLPTDEEQSQLRGSWNRLRGAQKKLLTELRTSAGDQ
jgi:hypothetical protein